MSHIRAGQVVQLRVWVDSRPKPWVVDSVDEHGFVARRVVERDGERRLGTPLMFQRYEPESVFLQGSTRFVMEAS